MCRRFAIERMNVTGASSYVEIESAGRYTGLEPGGMPDGTTPPAGHWHVADIAVELGDLTVRGPTDQPDSSTLTLTVEAL